MAMISLDAVSVDYPVFGADGESLKKALTAAATGGRIGRGTGLTVVEALRHVTLELCDGARLGVVVSGMKCFLPLIWLCSLRVRGGA